MANLQALQVEEEGLAEIFRKKPSFIDEVIVVNNRSTDRTEEVAKRNGAIIHPDFDLRRNGLPSG